MDKKLLYLAGISWGVSFLLLLPIWPLIFIFLLLFLKDKEFRKRIWFFVVGALQIFIFVIFYSDVSKYFYNTITINLKYYIFNDSGLGFWNILNSFFPFYKIFFNPGEHTQFLQLLRSLSIIYFLFSIYLIYKRKIRIVLLSLIFLGLINLRFIEPGLTYYQGFHYLPWFSLFIFTIFYLGKKVTELMNGKCKIIVFIILLFITALAFNTSRKDLFVKRDKETDYYINYSRQYSLGEAVRIMANKNDKLFVVPDEYLIYWQGNIAHASKYIFYYKSMENIDVIKNDIFDMFSKNPPTFVYCRDCQLTNIYTYLNSYKRIRKDGKYTDLYIRTNKIPTINNKQIEQLRYYNFEI